MNQNHCHPPTTTTTRATAAARFESRRRIVMGGLAATLAAVGGCGGAALFAPFFTFLFDGTVDGLPVTVSFQPDAASVGQSSGRFAATSNMTVNNLDEFKFSGTFEGRNMKLNVIAASAPLATGYDGVFTDDDTVAFTTTDVDRRGFVARRRKA